MKLTLRPELLYLVVFGPSFGESIVIRVPDSTWVVVDAFLPAQGEVLAKKLLTEHHAQWSGVVLTHPHLDHAPGLDQVIAGDGGGFVGAVAPYVKAPRKWIHSPDPEEHRRGSVEHTLAAIQTRWEAVPGDEWELRAGAKRSAGDATFTVLHPDDETLKELDPTEDRDKNRWSTPLLVEWRSLRLLLGADLENPGWEIVAARKHEPPLHDHHGYKVAHHGSREALHECASGGGARGRKWIATPWNRGKKTPRFEDGQGVDLILRSVDALELTSYPFAPPSEPGSVEVLRRDVAAMQSAAAGGFPTMVPAPPPGIEDDAWVAIGFAEDGATQDVVRGARARVIRESR